MARLKAIASKMDENLLLSDLSVALGQLYLSVGVDMIPEEVLSQPLPKAVETLKSQLARSDNFASYIDKTYYDIFKEIPTLPGTTTQYTIQLFATNDLQTAQSRKNAMAFNDSLTIAKMHNGNRDWYVITYGKYKTYQEAKDRMHSLPNEFSQYSPWIRKTSSLIWAT